MCKSEFNNPVEPEPPVHEHSYVDGKCECGAVDPDYVKPEQPSDQETPKEEKKGCNVGFVFVRIWKEYYRAKRIFHKRIE